jgi:hypothetical protein
MTIQINAGACDLGDCAWVKDGIDAVRGRQGMWYVGLVKRREKAWVSIVYRCSEQLQDTMADPDPLPDDTLIKFEEVIYQGPSSPHMTNEWHLNPAEAVAHIPLEDVATLVCHPNESVREAALRRLAQGSTVERTEPHEAR